MKIGILNLFAIDIKVPPFALPSYFVIMIPDIFENLLNSSDIPQEPHPQPFECRNLDVKFLKKFIAKTQQLQ